MKSSAFSHLVPATVMLPFRSDTETTHFVFSGSFSLIFSSTLISSRAASLYFSTFLMILRATRAPPLGRNGREAQDQPLSCAKNQKGLSKPGSSHELRGTAFRHLFSSQKAAVTTGYLPKQRLFPPYKQP